MNQETKGQADQLHVSTILEKQNFLTVPHLSLIFMFGMSLKRHRGDRSLSTDDVSVKRIVRHKEHHDSPPGGHDSLVNHDGGRKRSLNQREYHHSRSFNDTRGSYNKFSKYSSSQGNSEADRSPTVSSRDRHVTRDHHHSQFMDHDTSPPPPPPPRHHSNKPHHSHYNDNHDSVGNNHINSSGGGSSILDQIDYSLHISNLEVRVSDDELRKVLFREFKRYGFISIKILGYGKDRKAFVNYHNYDEARKARKETQHFRVFGRPIHVEWSKQTLLKYPEVATGKTRSSGPSMTDSHRHSSYYDDFHGNSDRISSSETTHTTSRSSRSNNHDRGVLIEDHDDKRDVSYRSSGNSNPTRVTSSSSIEAKQVVPITDPNATRTLFVGNLELDTTERELRDLFSQYGRIESVDIKLAKSAGTTYAFVKFTTITDAMNAKEDMHGRLYGNTKLKIGFGKGSPTGKVWVGNLKSTRDLAEVRHEMDRFGLVRRCDYRDGDNHAYIHFESLDAAQAAVSALDGFRLRNGRNVKLDLHKPLFLREGEESFSGSDIVHTPRRDSDEYTPSSHHRHHSDREIVSTSNYTSSNRKSTDEYYRSKDRVVNDDTNDHRDRNQRKRHRSLERPIRHVSSSSRQREEHNDEEVSHSKRRPINYESRQNPREYRHHSSDRPSRNNSSRHSDGEYSRKLSERDSDKEVKYDEAHDKKSDKTTTVTTSTSKGNSESSIQQALSEEASATTIMMESDSALKLNNSTEPVSPESIGKTNKPDSPHHDSLTELAKLYPSPWRGNLVLKNTGFPARMYLIGGDPSVAESLLRCKDEQSALRITQRLRLEQPRLDEVNKRISLAGPSGHCILFALPGSTANQNSPENDRLSMQLRPLRSLVSYLKQKEAAGIVALSAADFGEVSENRDPKEVVGVLHAFPPCEFSHSQLNKIIPSLGPEPSKEDHIVVLLVKGNV